ncbi:MAG: Crp/Fnr family transcriptional regulator [Flavobacteriales bacterium]|nr:CRP-like cAMP-activated global transcriptional regulator [Flavobacteriales bacterium]MCC6578291.1 Crp/Fnr family transcriptional regulator [Flavobacteriales bacterium]NUQ15157.1 Crp/Fnr family transcriptional regulator [Flavobacteriales bacterium]
MGKAGSTSHQRLDELIRLHCSLEWRRRLRDHNIQGIYAKGEAIFRSGDQADRMFMVDHGRVKVVADVGNGQGRIIRLAGDGEMLGHRALGRKPAYTASAFALVPTRVNAIPMALFLRTLQENPRFCYHFLLEFAAEMRQLDQHLRDLRTMDVAQRVVRTLLVCRDTFGMDIADSRRLAFTLPRRDIASMADTTYESVVRSLSSLQQEGLIQLVGKSVRLLRPKALEERLR